MDIRAAYSSKCFLTMVALPALLYMSVATATQFNTLVQIMDAGSTTVISIDPVLPDKGEPFTINVTGEWRNRCIPDKNTVQYNSNDFVQGHVSIFSNLVHNNNCGTEFEPTPYQLSITVQNTEWESLGVSFTVKDAQTKITRMSLSRSFDLIFGLHDVPPRLSSGYWLSEETPYQGLLIEQQANTVVMHELNYNRVSGEPNWLYTAGKFNGNSFNSVAFKVNWLSPVAGFRRAWINNPAGNPSIIPEDRQVQPERQELAFNASSAGLRVLGVNSIWAFMGLHELDTGPHSENQPHPVPHLYRRWVFGLSSGKPPPVVPDMVGHWNLYGFSGQQLQQTYQVEFITGSKIGDDLYHFPSVEGAWDLECEVSLSGEGDCTLMNESLSLTMVFGLYPFNGNFAKAPLVYSNPTEPGQIGILLRSEFHLPVLDKQ